MIKKLTFVVTALAVVFLAGCGSNSNSGTDGANGEGNKIKHKIAYVTNGIDPFWDLCAAGVRQAESELGGVECEIHFPSKGLADQ